MFDLLRQNPNAQAQLRAPIYEEKVVDLIFGLAEVTDKPVSKDELLAEDDLPEGYGDAEVAPSRRRPRRPRPRRRPRRASRQGRARAGRQAEAAPKAKAAGHSQGAKPTRRRKPTPRRAKPKRAAKAKADITALAFAARRRGCNARPRAHAISRTTRRRARRVGRII